MEGNHQVYGVMCAGINNGVMGKKMSVNTVICVDSVNIPNVKSEWPLSLKLILFILKTIETIVNTELREVVKWLRLNKLSLNAAKN